MNLNYRHAQECDLPDLVEMLADDNLGSKREDISFPLNPGYSDAFHNITADPNNELLVVDSDGELAGMLQLTYIPYLTHKGSWRCLIEGVRISKNYRRMGVGTHILQWAIKRAKDRSCSIVQLTSDKQRRDAIRFYEELGFIATHEGFKLIL